MRLRNVVVALLMIVALLVVAIPSSGQDRTEERLNNLETRVAELEAEVFPTEKAAKKEKRAKKSDGQQATVGGNALGLLPTGIADEVSVIASGALEYGQIPLVVRNNTDEAVAGVVVKIELRDTAGELVGVADRDGGHPMKPYLLQPGDVAIGFVFIEGDVPADSEIEFTTTYEDPPGMLGDFNIDLEFPDVTWLMDRVVGTAVNPSDETIGGYTYMNMVCFDEEGTPIDAEPNVIEEEIGPGDAVTFQGGDLVHASNCENFLIAATGHPKN
jgi:hypothetical protein